MRSQSGLKLFLTIIVSFVLLAGAFSGGVITGWLLPLRSNQAQTLTPQANLTEQGILPTQMDPTSTPFPLPTRTIPTSPPPTAGPGNTASTEVLFAPFWQAWDLVHQEYVDQPVNDETLMQGAIRGMLASLGDKHTSYMDPYEYKQENGALQGDYEGIGAWVDTTGQSLRIISPMPNSPAEKAGLKANDKVIAVDGKDVSGMDGSLVIRMVLGPAGSKVTLTIVRDGQDQPFDVVIVRAEIITPSVSGKMLNQNIAYVQLTIFGDTTGADLRKTLTELMAKKPSGLILDLRNNGGGYLSTAIEVASQFISSDANTGSEAKGVALIEQYGNGQRKSYTVNPGGIATQIPLVVLVNEGTASASEIVSGAIQDYGRGKLVGVQTYGKGSVQLVSELDKNEGAVRVTIAHWLTPRERMIDGLGLTPDVVVKLTDADIKANLDPQLQKALELFAQK